MVYLNWKSPIGTTGKGRNITDIEANAWIKYLGDAYPTYTHWLTDD